MLDITALGGETDKDRWKLALLRWGSPAPHESGDKSRPRGGVPSPRGRFPHFCDGAAGGESLALLSLGARACLDPWIAARVIGCGSLVWSASGSDPSRCASIDDVPSDAWDPWTVPAGRRPFQTRPLSGPHRLDGGQATEPELRRRNPRRQSADVEATTPSVARPSGRARPSPRRPPRRGRRPPVKRPRPYEDAG